MSFKSFKQFIDEDCGRDAKSLGGDGGAQNQYGRWGQEPVHLGVHRIEDPNVLQRLNAHVGLVNTKEYIDPRSALEHIQNALMRLGYQFEYNLDTLPHEQNVYPLRRFGGRQGFIDMDAQVKEDDGIVQTTGQALVLNVEFVRDDSSSRYEVMAQIVPASLFDEDDTQPDPIRPNRAGRSSTDGDRDGINIGEEFPPKSKGPTRFKGDPKVKVDKVKGGFQVFVHSPRGFWIAQGQPWKTKAQADKDAKKFNEECVLEAVVAVRRVFPFKDLSTAQKFIRNIDHSVLEIRIKDPKTRFPQVLAGFKNDADATKATKLAKKLGSSFQEDISRTFAFATPDARDRAEKLFGMSSSGRVTTSDKGKGKFKFTATGNFKGAQLDRIAKSVTQLKGVMAEDMVEDIARTFVFPTSDARDRMAKLLGLAGSSKVTTADKSKGMFKFAVSSSLRNAQLARIEKSVKDLKGVTEETSDDIAVNAVRRAIRERAASGGDKVLFAKKSKKGGDLWDVTIKFGTDFSDTGVGFGTRDASIRNQGKALQNKFKKAGLKFFSTNMADGHAQVSLDAKNSGDAKQKVSKILGESFASVAKGHQMKIARDTLKMNDVFARVMGGMTKKQAAEFLMKNGNSKDKKEAKLELQREQLEEATRDAGREVARNVLGMSDAQIKRKGGLDRQDAARFLMKHGTSQEKKLAKPHLAEAKDENEKELERTRKDGKLASAFSEAADFTLVAIKNNKVVDQFHSLEKKEIKLATEVMKKQNPGAKISVERRGKVVSVEQVTEQISNSSPAWGY